MKASEAFKDMPITGDQITEFSRQLIAELDSGDLDPLKFKIALKAIEKTMEIIKPTLDKLARDAAEQYGEKSFNLIGAKVELKEAGARYDYTLCGWPVRNRIEVQRQEIDAKLKECDTFLKSIKSPTTIVDEDTGEVVTVHPPVKTATSTVQITFK
jgi:hypothetical protein